MTTLPQSPAVAIGGSSAWVDGHLLDDLGDVDLTPKVWIDGDVVPATTPVLSALDRGFQSGIGVFTSFRMSGGHLPPTWPQHLERLASGGARVGVHVPSAARITEAVQATVAADQRDDVAVRVTITAGPTGGETPTMVVSTQRPGGREPDTAITMTSVRGLPGVKSTSYADVAVVTAEAIAAGADTALLVDDGWVLEAATSAVAIIRDGVLRTPVGSILPSITMEEVAAHAPSLGLEVVFERVAVADLMAADEALLASAVRGVRGLVAVDGSPISDGRTGPMTTALADHWQSLHHP